MMEEMALQQASLITFLRSKWITFGLVCLCHLYSEDVHFGQMTI